jgi:hypothetical protein
VPCSAVRLIGAENDAVRAPVVVSDDDVLILPRGRSQDVKILLEAIKDRVA